MTEEEIAFMGDDFASSKTSDRGSYYFAGLSEGYYCGYKDCADEKDKQIEELKKQVECNASGYVELQNNLFEVAQKNNELEAQIEKMKCCGNCAKHNKCMTYNKFWGMAMTSNMVDYGCVANLDHYSKWKLKE